MEQNMKKKIWDNIQKIKALSPLVHNITNYVVMNSSANILLAAGASPVMAHAEEEVRDMVGIANALVLNIGTLSSKWIDSMIIALKEANRLGKPVILDPVGAGATAYRTRTVKDLLRLGQVSIIRGNASEIMALVSESHKTKGVDSTESASDAIESAKLVQNEYKCVVCASGRIDYIISGDEIAEIHNGHKMMPRITGMGCAATSLIGAFAGIMDNYFEAAVSGMALMGVAGELAAEKSEGPASMQIHFIDKLHNISEEEFLSTIKMKIYRYV
jgi:hydroxyethylthiazole kinase